MASLKGISQKMNECPLLKIRDSLSKKIVFYLLFLHVFSSKLLFFFKTKIHPKKSTKHQIRGTKVPFTCDHLIALKVTFLIPLRLPQLEQLSRNPSRRSRLGDVSLRGLIFVLVGM